MSRLVIRLAQQTALIFGSLLLRIILRDIAWMTWKAAKDRMASRSFWRRQHLSLNFNAHEIMVSGPSGTRRIMDDDHIKEWWGEEEEEEHKGPLW